MTNCSSKWYLKKYPAHKNMSGYSTGDLIAQQQRAHAHKKRAHDSRLKKRLKITYLPNIICLNHCILLPLR